MKDYYSFIYLDDDAIDILYPQVFGDIVEKNIIHSSEESTDASLNSSILNILGANTSSKENCLSSENVKIVTSTARKSQLLIKHFQDSKLSLQDIIMNNQPFTESLFFVGKDVFFLSDIYNKKTGISLFSKVCGNDTQHITLDNDSVLILETGDTAFIKKHCSDYIDEDDYYVINSVKNKNYGIMMHMSNSKIKKNIRHLTWVIKKAEHFNFFVFGELIKSGNTFYKISPFAIWQ